MHFFSLLIDGTLLSIEQVNATFSPDQPRLDSHGQLQRSSGPDPVAMGFEHDRRRLARKTVRARRTRCGTTPAPRAPRRQNAVAGSRSHLVLVGRAVARIVGGPRPPEFWPRCQLLLVLGLSERRPGTSCVAGRMGALSPEQAAHRDASVASAGPG